MKTKILKPTKKNLELASAELKNYKKVTQVYNAIAGKNLKPVVVCLKHEKGNFKNTHVKTIGKTNFDYAKNIYSFMRKLEKKFNYIIVCAVENKGFGVAIMNRVKKMHSPNAELEKL